MEQLGTELSWTEDSESFARFTLCFEWKRMLTKHVCMLWVVWGFWVFICLSMMMASNVLEGIQKLELLTDLREALWTEWNCAWLIWPCGWTCLNCCVHVFGCCKCGHEHMVQSSCHGTWWKLGKNSDGIWVKMKTSRKSDAMKIEMLYFHVMIWDLNKKFHTFEIIRMDQTLKGGQRYLCRS